MKIGDSIKVHLPGEAPWAIVTATLEDGRVLARIDNETVGGLHGYKYGDVATFEVDSSGRWALSDLSKQRPNGPRPAP